LSSATGLRFTSGLSTDAWLIRVFPLVMQLRSFSKGKKKSKRRMLIYLCIQSVE
jgi:hypothetical protein